MIRKPIPVEVYTTTHRARGLIHPGAAGLFATLNLPTESFIELEEAEFSRLHEINKEPDRPKRLWLVKADIAAVAVGSRGELGPTTAALRGYTKPFPHWVRVFVQGYELVGQVQTGGQFDFGALMSEGEATFLPLFEASLSATLFPRVRTQARALLFNRRLVNAMYLLPREQIPGGGEA